jgi:ABC-type phosphate transport system substrate-binding protein
MLSVMAKHFHTDKKCCSLLPMLDWSWVFMVSILFFLMCFFSPVLQAAPMPSGVVVVTNPSVKTAVLDRNRLRSIFAMRSLVWPGGENIHVFVLEDEHPTHARFTKSILHTFPYNLRRIWNRRIYSGIGQSPVVVHTEEEMREAVSTTENAIGYLSNKWLNDKLNVKILELQ